MMAAPRILFLGQKPIGEQCFWKLCETQLPIAGVVTNADSARGWWKSSEIWSIAAQKDFARLDNSRRRHDELIELIRGSRPDVLVSVQHKWVLPAEILGLVPRAFNLHLAPLPTYKGYYPFNHVILRREATFGVVVHHIVPDIDAGPIAYEEKFAVDSDETAGSLYKKSADAGVRIFERLLTDLAAGREPPAVPQQGEGRFYERHEIEPFREVPSDAAPEEIALRARAFHFPPFPGAFMRAGGQKIFLVPG